MDDTSQRTEDRLTALEIKASFAEDLLDRLNEVIVRQQRQIELLTAEITQMRAHEPAPDGGALRSLRDELPPHY